METDAKRLIEKKCEYNINSLIYTPVRVEHTAVISVLFGEPCAGMLWRWKDVVYCTQARVMQSIGSCRAHESLIST